MAAIKLTALHAPTIQKFINDLQASVNGHAGLSPKSVKCIHGILHCALQKAVVLGYMRTNPADACTLPRAVKKEIKPLDKTQISVFLNAIRGHEFETLYLFTLFSGMRQSEVIGLRWKCVDFTRGIITVNAQVLRDYENGGYYFAEYSKNDKVLYIAPASFVMAALTSHKAKQKKERLHAGPAWVENDYVFTNALGNHLIHGTVYKGYKRIVSGLGIPASRFHDLRHSFAVSSLQAGDDIKTVQENLGHHTAAFTLDVYGHITEQMRKESSARMDKFIRNILKI
jgi:integrase